MAAGQGVPKVLSGGYCVISESRWSQIRGGVKALVFRQVTSGQVKPDHTMTPSTLEPEVGAYEGLVPCPSRVRCQALPTAPQNSECTLRVFAGYTEVEKCC